MKDDKKRSSNWDDVFERLSSDNPEDWPEAFRATRGKVSLPPASLRARVFEGVKKIEEERELASLAEKEAGLKQSVVVLRVPKWAVLSAAASLLLAMFIGSAAYYVLGDAPASVATVPEGPRIARIAGRAYLYGPARGEQKAGIDDELSPGALLLLDSNARAELRGAGQVSIRFDGPGRIQRVRKPARPGVGILLKSGALRVRIAGGSKKEPYFFATRERFYIPLGTRFSLERSSTRERLQVHEGAVKVVNRRTGNSVVVPAGSARAFRQVSAAGPPAGNISRGSAAPERFKDLVAIRKRYGVLHELILNDGRKFRGFVHYDRENDVKIVMPGGPRRFRIEEVRKIRVIWRPK